jgi:predicted 2-oxoglutarate/Fe(II)-dependent dioxygenase YbiX
MPAANFFRSLGLFVRNDFLNPATCSGIRAEMSAGEAEKALIYETASDNGVLDESVRKSFSIRVGKSTKAMVKERIAALKPLVEEHFQMPLGKLESPSFLSYGQGMYFKRHLDATEHPDIAARKVSLVIFLSPRAQEPAADCYGGGALTFYGLMKGPKWEDCAFSLEPDLGLLVGFRSDTPHEVQPVTFGQRCTVVSWFRAEA